VEAVNGMILLQALGKEDCILIEDFILGEIDMLKGLVFLESCCPSFPYLLGQNICAMATSVPTEVQESEMTIGPHRISNRVSSSGGDFVPTEFQLSDVSSINVKNICNGHGSLV
jgi:hypothetical protein